MDRKPLIQVSRKLMRNKGYTIYLDSKEKGHKVFQGNYTRKETVVPYTISVLKVVNIDVIEIYNGN